MLCNMQNKALVFLTLSSIFLLVLGASERINDNQHNHDGVFFTFQWNKIWSVLALALFFYNFYHMLSRRFQVTYINPTKHDISSKRVQLSMIAHLASMSYCTSSIKPSRDNSGRETVVPNLVHSSDYNPIEINDAGNIIVFVRNTHSQPANPAEYHIEATYANNAVWLLRRNAARQNDPIAKWVVLFRGTKTLDDLKVDGMLIAAVASDGNAGFVSFLNKRATQLTDLVFKDNDVRKCDSIILVGHSLGGTVAEAMLARLHADKYRNVSAYVFDTPGLPESERSKFPNSLWRKLTIVYARDNPINNLCPAPPNAVAYLMDTRDPSELRGIWSWMQSLKRKSGLQGVMALVSAKSLYKCLGPHCIERIARGIENGSISRDDYVSARKVSGTLLRWIFGFLSRNDANRSAAAMAHFADSTVRSKKMNLKTNQSKARLEHREFPGAEAALREYIEENESAKDDMRMPKVMPYSVSDLRKFTVGMIPGRDIVIPFIGLTSVGKSSLLKAILKLSPDDMTIVVGAVMNVTITPAVILWKVETYDGEQYRIWLMDLPGVRGTSTLEDEDSNQFVDVDIPTQLALLSESVQAACFVCGDNAKEEDKKVFAQAYNVLKERIVVAHNVKGLAPKEELDALTDEIEREFGSIMGSEDEKARLKVVSVRVARSRAVLKIFRNLEFGVPALENELLKSYKEWSRKITEEMEERRRIKKEGHIEARAKEIEEEMPIFWDSVAVGSQSLGAAAGTAATAIGGAATLEAFGFGVLVTLGTGGVAAGVAAGVGVGVGIAGLFRRKQKRKGIARAKAEEEFRAAEQGLQE